MNIGKTLFAQLMDFLPWKTFHRIVDRYDGDRYVKSMTCANHFRVMAFAQLTYRESLRDIEVCLSAQSAKLYHMGMRQEVKGSPGAQVKGSSSTLNPACAVQLTSEGRSSTSVWNRRTLHAPGLVPGSFWLSHLRMRRR